MNAPIDLSLNFLAARAARTLITGSHRKDFSWPPEWKLSVTGLRFIFSTRAKNECAAARVFNAFFVFSLSSAAPGNSALGLLFRLGVEKFSFQSEFTSVNSKLLSKGFSQNLMLILVLTVEIILGILES